MKVETQCQCGRAFTLEREVAPGVRIGVECPACRTIFSVVTLGTPDRARQTKTEALQANLLDIFSEMQPPMTVRQIFYQAETRGLVPKTQAGYRQILYQILAMRRQGIIPFGWVTDGTRWAIRPTTYRGLDAALDKMQQFYRRDLWESQPVAVDFWIEKLALAGVVSPITQEYGVPLCVARGFPSASFLYEMAEEIKSIGKPLFLYVLGDYDASGISASESIEREMKRHGAEIQFQRIAVTPEQITTYRLPTRPPKEKDPRARKWGDKPCVELDALRPPILRALVRSRIESHIDWFALDRIRKIEALERQTLGFVSSFVPEQNFAVPVQAAG